MPNAASVSERPGGIGNMTVRPARLPDDEPAILSFIWGLQKFEREFEANRRLDSGFAAEHWADVHTHVTARGAIFIAEADGRAVGWAVVFWKKLAICSWRKANAVMALSRNYSSKLRHAGRGHGRALIAACEDWSRERGMTVLIIGVLTGNGKAAALYQRDGFSPYNLFMRKYL